MKRWLLFFLFFLLQTSYATNPNSLRILSLSDIHFNPFTSCSTTKNSCSLIDDLQKNNIQNWSILLQKSDTKFQYRGRDTGYPLLMSSLTEAKKAAKNHQVQIVIVLGDNLAHEYTRLFKRYSHDKSSSAYHHFVNQTIEFLFYQLSLTFPSTPIYIAVGNNDTYQNNYTSQPKGQFLKETANDAARLMPANQRNNFIQQFQNAGYYSVLLNQNIRLLMLNSVLFSYKAKGDGVSAAAIDQLIWLKKQLHLAKLQNEKVIIAMHIPPVYDFYLTSRVRVMTLFQFWHKEYIIQYDQLLQEFSHQIIGVIAGHQHTDQLKYTNFYDGYEIPMLSTSSISPIFGNDPQFSVYTFSLTHFQLIENVPYTQKLSE